MFIRFLLLFYYFINIVCIENDNNVINNAIKEHSNGNIDKALYLYKKSFQYLELELYNNHTSQVYSNIGAIYIEKGKYKIAKNYFLKSIESSNYTNINAYFNLAVITTSKLFQHELALEYCLVAYKLSLYSTNSNHHNNKIKIKITHLIANIYQNLNNEQKSNEYLQLAQNLSEEEEREMSNSPDIDNSKNSNNWYISSLFQLKLNEIITIPIPNEPNVEPNITHISVTCVSHSPYIYTIKSVLNDAECEHLINRGLPLLQRSYVSGSSSSGGGDVSNVLELELEFDGSVRSIDMNTDNTNTTDTNLSNINANANANAGYRDSTNTWLRGDDTIKQIKNKIAHILDVDMDRDIDINTVSKQAADIDGDMDTLIRGVGVRVGLGLELESEEMQLVRYKEEERFRLHHDSSGFHKRHVTVLFYLNTVPNGHGGETWFPYGGSDSSSDSSSGECVNDRNIATTGSSTGSSSTGSSSTGSTGSSIDNILLNNDTNTRLLHCIEYARHRSSTEPHPKHNPNSPLNTHTKPNTKPKHNPLHFGLAVTPVKGDGVLFFNHIPIDIDSRSGRIGGRGSTSSGSEGDDHSSGTNIHIKDSGNMSNGSNGRVKVPYQLDVRAIHAGLPIHTHSDEHSTSSNTHANEKWIANLWY